MPNLGANTEDSVFFRDMAQFMKLGENKCYSHNYQ